MKNNIYILSLLLLLVICSCKKDNKSNTTPGTLHKVTITIGGNDFSQKIVSGNSVPGKADAVVTDPSLFKNYIDSLYININNDVHTYSTKTLTSLSLSITEQLPAGNYSVYGAGGQKGMGIVNSWVYYPPAQDYLPLNTGIWYDTFSGSQQFTVSNSDINVTLQLNRVDADVEIVIEDALPANTDHFTVLPSIGYNFYDMSAQAVVNQPTTAMPTTFTVPDTSKGKTNFTMDFLTLNTLAPFNITLTAYSTNNTVIASKAISNISVAANQKAIYSGIMFGGSNPSAGGFKGYVDTAWGTTPILKTFSLRKSKQ